MSWKTRVVFLLFALCVVALAPVQCKPAKRSRKSSSTSPSNNRQSRTFGLHLFGPHEWPLRRNWQMPIFQPFSNIPLLDDEDIHDSLNRRITKLENEQKRIMSYLRVLQAERRDQPCDVDHHHRHHQPQPQPQPGFTMSLTPPVAEPPSVPSAPPSTATTTTIATSSSTPNTPAIVVREETPTPSTASVEVTSESVPQEAAATVAAAPEEPHRTHEEEEKASEMPAIDVKLGTEGGTEAEVTTSIPIVTQEQEQQKHQQQDGSTEDNNVNGNDSGELSNDVILSSVRQL